MTGLDPRKPLVIDVRTLQRRPGSMTTLTRRVPAPAGLGVAMARVPEGSPIDLDLRLESVLEGVLVTGSADLQISAECSRCLDPVGWHEEFDLTELFRYPPTDAHGAVVLRDRPHIVDLRFQHDRLAHGAAGDGADVELDFADG